MNIPHMLKKLGYNPVTNVDQILTDSIKKALDELGGTTSRTLMRILSSLHGVPESEFLTNYSLVMKTLRDIFGEGANIISFLIKENVLQHLKHKNLDLTVEQMISYIREEETLDFILQLKGREHILFLYKNEDSKDKIISSFFDPSITSQTAAGLYSARPTKLKHINNILFQDFVYLEKNESKKKALDWGFNLVASNKSDLPTRIGFEDLDWGLENGFADLVVEFETSTGRNFRENISHLCGYNVTRFSEKHAQTIVESHGYVITDEPLIVYRLDDKKWAKVTNQ